MNSFADGFWGSEDGLKLHYRDYPGPEGDEALARPPVICLAGLTRNARDFAGVAERISPRWRVICPDMRGRGSSAYAENSGSYNLGQYLSDLRLLLAELKLCSAVFVGTSLGGLMTMALAIEEPEKIAGVLLNDIGPVVEPAGLRTIMEYVAQNRSFPTWMHAARALADIHGKVFPDYTLLDWLAMAKRTMTLTDSGRIIFDYDMKIAEPFRALDPESQGLDLWPGIDALAHIPVALVRGSLSRLLSRATLQQMAARLPAATVTHIPRVGHAPTLDEPEAIAALDGLLDRVAAR